MWPILIEMVRVEGVLPIRFTTDGATVVLHMDVLDVGSGRPVTLTIEHTLPMLREKRAMLLWLRARVHELYMHEADEQFFMGDLRPFYPDQEHESNG